MAEAESSEMSAMNTRSSQPPEPASGPPPPSEPRSSEIVLVEIAKMQSDGEYLKREVSEMRKDAREVRDRLIALETNVSHLPSKGFIITVMVVGISLLTGVLAILPKLQVLVNATPLG